jgi:hypothetical protein
MHIPSEYEHSREVLLLRPLEIHRKMSSSVLRPSSPIFPEWSFGWSKVLLRNKNESILLWWQF